MKVSPVKGFLDIQENVLRVALVIDVHADNISSTYKWQFAK